MNKMISKAFNPTIVFIAIVAACIIAPISPASASNISDYPNTGWIWEDSTTLQITALNSTTGQCVVAKDTTLAVNTTLRQADYYFGLGILDFNTTTFTGTSYTLQLVDATTYSDVTLAGNYPGNIIDSFTLSSSDIIKYFATNSGSTTALGSILPNDKQKYYRAWSPLGRSKPIKKGIWVQPEDGFLSPKIEIHFR